MIALHGRPPLQCDVSHPIHDEQTTSYTLKRLLDVTIAFPCIIFLSPLFVVVAILIKLDSPGSVLFKQKRRGRNFRHFTMWKFRSLREAPDPHARYEMQAADPRITRIGAFLRRTSIDELPQLFNVISGSMSLVGPRPLVEWESQECLARHRQRFSMKPGLTGLAQIRLRNAGDLDERCDLDAEYIQNWSLSLDFKILSETPWALLRGGTIYSAPKESSRA